MDRNWTIIIRPKNGWLDIHLKEIIGYKDLIFLFVKRNFVVQYKQTILGPLWFILNPLITTFIYTFIFGGIAGLSTDGVPHFLFYLTSQALWMYFSTCITQTAATFTGNAAILGKVYFPRLIMPISTVIFSLTNFFVVFFMSILMIGYYVFQKEGINPNIYIALVPLFIFQVAMLGLGCGIIVSAVTTKYRDLALLVSFGVQLWMYITPVVYPISQIPGKWRGIVMLNPLASIMNNFRYALLGCGHFEVTYWVISILITTFILVLGVILFSRVEKTFMDTI